MPGSFYEEDEWHERDYHRGYGYVQPPRPPPRRSGDLLAPLADYGGSSLRRSRSQGHSPAPNIYVYNRTDVDQHDVSPSRGRSNDRTSAIVDRLDDIGRDVRRISRSRGPEQRGVSPWRQQMEYEEHMRLQEANAQIARLESERRYQHEFLDRQREEELRRKRMELEALRAERRHDNNTHWDDREKLLKEKLQRKALQDEIDKLELEAKSKDQRDRILLENERAIAKAKADREKIRMELKLQEDEEEEERKKLIAEARAKDEKKKKQAEEEEKAAVARYEQKKLDAKKKEDEMRAKFKAEEEAKKLKEKKEEEEWELRLKMKKQKEKDEQKEKEKELEEEMHKKLAVFGFQENQIQAVLNPKKANDLPAGYSPGNPRPHRHQAIGWTPTPTYIKVSRDHLDIETLKYYNLRYEVDSVS